MANDFYTATGAPVTGAQANASTWQAEYALVEDGFDKVSPLTGKASLPVFVNAAATAQEAIAVASAQTLLGIQPSALISAAAGRSIRTIGLWIKDGTTAATIKPSVVNVYNGVDLAEENNLAASGDTGNFSLSAGGLNLYIDGSVGGTPDAVISVNIAQYCATPAQVIAYIDTGKITVALSNSTTSAPIDLTTMVDSGTGTMYILITYITH